MHEVVVMKILCQIYPQSEIDERKVKAGAIVCIDCVNTTQGPEQVSPACIIPNKLNQAAPTVIG